MKKNVCFMVLTTVLNLMFCTSLAQETPQPGDIILTEMMIDPLAVSDTKGEWIEIFNASNFKLKLNGMIIRDEGSNKHTIEMDEDLTMDPGQYLILAKNGDPAENGGLIPDYVYSSFSLGNTADEVILELEDGTLLDRVDYGDGWKIESGTSLELSNNQMTTSGNDDQLSWHHAVQIFGQGDLGTPGKENSMVSSNAQPQQSFAFEVYPNPVNEQLFIRIELPYPQKVQLNIVNLLGQTKQLFDMDQCFRILQGFDLSYRDKGIYFIQLLVGDQEYVHKILIQ